MRPMPFAGGRAAVPGRRGGAHRGPLDRHRPEPALDGAGRARGCWASWACSARCAPASDRALGGRRRAPVGAAATATSRWSEPELRSRSPETSPRSSRQRPIGDRSGVDTGVSGRLSCLPPSSRPLSGRRHPAGCPSGQWERTVNPSAKPTKVRILHLPPTRGRDCWQSRPRACP